MSYSLDPDDLASYPGVTIGNTKTRDLVVRLTEGKINAIVGDTELDDAQLADVDTIAFEVAARSLSNPTGATSITTGIDDWKKTLRYEGETALARRAGVYLTPDEKTELRNIVGATTVAPTARRRSLRLHVPGVSRAHH